VYSITPDSGPSQLSVVLSLSTTGSQQGALGAPGVQFFKIVFCIFIASESERYLTDKKENQIFLKYKEIQNVAVAKSYMTNGFNI
jgi:hypothetical protein